MARERVVILNYFTKALWVYSFSALPCEINSKKNQDTSFIKANKETDVFRLHTFFLSLPSCAR